MRYEEIMEDKILKFIEDEGYFPYVQIPFSLGKIDFVGINDNECIIIETKIKNWKKALKQTILYGYGVEKAYIALPNPTASYVQNKYYDLLMKYDIGLIEVTNSAKILIQSKNKEPSKIFKNIILKEIFERKKRSNLRINKLLEKYNND